MILGAVFAAGIYGTQAGILYGMPLNGLNSGAGVAAGPRARLFASAVAGSCSEGPVPAGNRRAGV